MTLLWVAQVEAVCCKNILENRQEIINRKIHKHFIYALKMYVKTCLDLPHVSYYWCISPRMLHIHTHLSVRIWNQGEGLVKPPETNDRTGILRKIFDKAVTLGWALTSFLTCHSISRGAGTWHNYLVSFSSHHHNPVTHRPVSRRKQRIQWHPEMFCSLHDWNVWF